ncbi:outer membrane protein assembly factor BamD [Candidatus Pandoraea novymonadis]|nr:outer membrane protein assembly factor BamD [Candidatus Pandoraea novymonadis]
MQTLIFLKQLTISTILGLSLVSCSILPEKVDETASWSTGKLYSEAKIFFDSGNYTKAAKYYELVEGRDPFSKLSQQAKINAAYCYYKDGDLVQALNSINHFVQLYPTSPSIDYAYYLKGLINFNDDLGLFGRFSGQDPSERDQKAFRDSYNDFKYLVERYPHSKYSKDAALRMRYALNAMAAYEAHVAQYYYHRGAYLAAVNRAQNALKEYDQAPANEDALIIMIRCYDALGMTQLSNDAKRVMMATYPNSDKLGLHYQRKSSDKSWWQIWK